MSVRKIKNVKLQARIRRSKRLNHQFKQSGKVRLRVYRTPRHMYAQVIKDGNVLVSASTREKDFSGKVTGNVESSALIGKLVGERAVAAGYDAVSFDRAGFRYHGRVKAVADAAREAGLRF